MNLQQIITRAGIGLAAGFYLGVAGTSINKERESLEFIEAAYGEDELEKRQNCSKEERNNSRKQNKRIENLEIVLYSLLYSTLDGFSNIFSNSPEHNVSPVEDFAVVLPTAYIGRVLGSAVRRFRRREEIKDMEIARKIYANPENALEYIPQERRKVLEDCFREFEEIPCSDMYSDETRKKVQDELFPKINKAISEGRKVYVKALKEYVERRLKDLCKLSDIQRKLIAFGEIPIANFLSFLEGTKSTKIRIYDFQGDKLAVYSSEVIDMSIVHEEMKDGNITRGEIAPLEIRIEKERAWDKDYRGTARRIKQDMKEGYCVGIMKSSSSLPMEARQFIISNGYISSYMEESIKNIMKAKNDSPLADAD